MPVGRYSAVIEWLPSEKNDVLTLARDTFAEKNDNGALPITAAPSRNTTLPVGTALALDTCAVKVTSWPSVEGFTLENTLVVVAIGALIDCARIPVLAFHDVFPISAPTKFAWIVWLPGVRFALVKNATELFAISGLTLAEPRSSGPSASSIR